MTNLLQELGVQYMVDRFQDCMFLDPAGNPAYIDSLRRWEPGYVAVNVVTGTPENPVVSEGQMEAGFFKDLNVFTVPPLGWRSSSEGRYLVNFWRNNRSYNRAVSALNVQRRFSPSTRYLVSTRNLNREVYDSQASTTLLIMKPEYTPFREGVEKMKRGEILSFAINPTLAVIPETDNRQSILFKDTRVAIVQPSGDLTFTFPSMQALVEDQL